MSTITVSMTQAKNELANVVNRVAYGGERIILLSRGKPRAAIVSFEDLQVLEGLQEDEEDPPGTDGGLVGGSACPTPGNPETARKDSFTRLGRDVAGTARGAR